MFEKASRVKLRFRTQRGLITAEDLWDLPLTGGAMSLDSIAKALSRELKTDEEESFVLKQTRANTTLILKLDIVKRVIEFKLAKAERSSTRAANRVKRERLLGILAKKEDAADENMSQASLRRMIEELEG